MKNYQYKARDKFGKLVSGFVEADSENALLRQLEQLNYVTLKITPAKGKGKSGQPIRRFRRNRVKYSDLNIFTRLLLTLQNAGLPLLSSLRAIQEQTENEYFRKIINEIAKDVEGGTNLSSALEKHPHVFNNLYVNMVKVGEMSGQLAETLDRLAVLGEHEEVFRARIKTALRYPCIVVAAIIVAFIVVITIVVPRYESIFNQFDTQLPIPTLILLGVNYAVTKFWWLTAILIAALTFICRKLLSTSRGTRFWHSLQLKIPVFGSLLLKLYMSRFSRITGTLLSSGVPILQILDLVSDSFSNVVVSDAVKEIRESVNAGKGMLGPMKVSGLFPPVVTQMVATGEETGKLDSLLIHVAEYYEAQINHTIANLVSLIEPLLIIMIGCAVLTMAMGIFLPLWNMMDVFQQ